MTQNRLLVVILFAFILTACSAKSATPADILNRVEKEHENIESVFINQEQIEHLDESLSYKATEKHDFWKGIYLRGNEEDGIYFYKDKGETLIVVNDEEVDASHDAYAIEDFKATYEMESQKNPLKQLKNFDENFYESFTMEEKEDVYVLSYSGNDEQKLSIVQGVIWSMYIQENSLVDSYEELDFTDVDLEITAEINKDSNRIELFSIYIKYSPPEQYNTRHVEQTKVNRYSKYDEVQKIEKPYVKANNPIPESTISDITLSNDQIAQFEKEAGEYVDGLIQATVFQNVEEYVRKIPGPESEEQKRKAGSLQQAFFRTNYEQNTMENMKGTGVTEKQVKDLTEAFLNAIAITKYEIKDATMKADDTVEVTLSIRGINESFINFELGEILREEYTAGKIEDKDVVNRNIELWIEAYNSNDRIMDPSEAIVEVMRNKDGTYFVILQDQYLLTFVQ